MRLDDSTTKEFLADCPNPIIKGTVYTDMSKEPEAWTNIQKEAVNKVIEWVKFQHIPHAETDNSMLITKYEEVEKENAVLVVKWSP